MPTPVVNSEGRVVDGFRWLDPSDTRDVYAVLKAEGVRFGPDYWADSSQHLKSEDLAELLGEVIEPAEEDRQ